MKKKELIELMKRKLEFRRNEIEQKGFYSSEYDLGFKDAIDAVKEFMDD